MFFRVKGSGKYRYLQLVENCRERYQRVQRVLCTLGRLDELEAKGDIGVLLHSLGRFARRKQVGDPKACNANVPHPGNAFRQGGQYVHKAASEISPGGFPAANESIQAPAPRGLKICEFPEGETRVEILRKCPMFSDFDTEHLVELSTLTSGLHLKPGQILFVEGDPAEYCYLVTSGMLKTLKHSRSGKDFITAIYSPGEIRGVLVLLLGKPHGATAQALTDTTVLTIRKDAFYSFLHRHPELIPKVLSIVIGFGRTLYQAASAQLSEFTAGRTGGRLARVLFALCLKFGPTIPLTRREIAEMSGTTTETATRFVSRLRSTGVIQSFRGKVVILDREKLRLLAQPELPEGEVPR
ncbi:MAG: Crp/Fnr family transcriptional regulator [Chloroflexi bacterium]|nr:Crp/Fnr family transcriptional regulator [Chloroflexota bacterium]